MRWSPGRPPGAFSFLFVLLLVPLTPARGQTPSRIVIDVPGSGIAARLGQMVAAAGDLNGDGRPDFAVASPGWGPTTSDSTGRVLIWFGGRDLSAAPDRVLTGFRRGAQFGFAVCGIGDVNGDGFDDLLVTAPGYDRGDIARYGSGRAYVYFGGAAFDDVPDRILDPVNFQAYGFARQLGSSAAGLGDIDGDGYPDWAIGFDNSQVIVRGGAYVYRGSASPASVPVILAKNNGGQRPVVAAAGDFDGDGLADLAIGAPFPSGTVITTTVCVYAGLIGSGGVDPIGTASATSAGFGAALTAADVNGDGLSDILIGQPLAGGGSQVRVILGSRVRNFGLTAESLISFLPLEQAPDSFGCSLAAGRVEGTGDLDLLVGASGDRSGGAGAGAVYLYRLQQRFGVPVPLPILVTTISGSPGDGFGARVAVPGDVDGNGVADLLVGAPQRAACGSARIFTLSPFTLVAPHSGEWPAGGAADVTWRGGATAHLDLSLDDGATWRTLAEGAGGLDVNTQRVAVPDTVSGRCRVRILPSGGPDDPLHSDRSDATFSIVRPARAWASASEGAPVCAPSGDDGRLGAALAAGDFGFGAPALAIGSPLADGAGPNAGRVLVQAADDPARALRIEGDAGGEHFGTALALGGDFDGDGHGDLLAGAPDRAGPGGRTGGVSLFAAGATTPAWRAGGSQDGESFGAAVTWIGDLDGDGRSEFAVGSPWFAPASARHGTGRVQVFRGGTPPARLLELDAPAGVSQFGRALAGLDLDGDGRGDLVVSGVGDDGSGVVMVWFGAALDTTPDLVLRRGSGDDRFGEAIAPAGDLNGDGFADLLIGAPGEGGAGRAFVVNGGPHPAPAFAHEFGGEEPGEDFGAALAAAGDLDGDGRDDFVAGAPLADGGRGAARVFLGGRDGPAACTWSGATTGERFGAALAVGSGHAFFAGAPFDERLGGGASGRVDRVSVARYVVDAPRPGARWFTGAAGTIAWRGGEPADVALSVDAGRTWTPLASHAVADPEHPLLVTVPSLVTDSALVRVRPSDPVVPGEVLRAFTIVHATEVRRFDFALETGGIRLTWDATPGIGPEGWSAWRIERDGDPPVTVGPARIEANELLVPDFTRGATYVLLGIDGNGAATELARTTVPAPATRFAAWPVPTASGDVQLSVFPPVDAAGRSPADFVVRVFDLHGRLVNAIVGGRLATSAGELRLAWNRRDDRGEVAGPGVYFVRAEAPGEGFRRERRIVLLR